jgi:DNA-binding LacI/PurR family transcriptional regulator
LVCEEDQANSSVIQLVRQEHPDLDITSDVASLRPSFLNQFSAVIDFAHSTPEEFLRELVVRNIAVVVVGREPRVYSTHAVVFDVALAAAQLGRDMVLAGHRRIATVESRRSCAVAAALLRAGLRYSPDVQVQTCLASELGPLVEQGVTAVVCEDLDCAAEVKKELDRLGVAVPQQVSIASLGVAPEHQPVSGYFLPMAEKARAILQLLGDPNAVRPTTLWLAGQYVDRGTVSPRIPPEVAHHHAAPH